MARLVAFPLPEMDSYVVDAGAIDIVVANDHTAARLTIPGHSIDLTGEQLLELGRFFSSAEMQALLARVKALQAALEEETAVLANGARRAA